MYIYIYIYILALVMFVCGILLRDWPGVGVTYKETQCVGVFNSLWLRTKHRLDTAVHARLAVIFTIYVGRKKLHFNCHFLDNFIKRNCFHIFGYGCATTRNRIAHPTVRRLNLEEHCNGLGTRLSARRCGWKSEFRPVKLDLNQLSAKPSTEKRLDNTDSSISWSTM